MAWMPHKQQQGKLTIQIEVILKIIFDWRNNAFRWEISHSGGLILGGLQHIWNSIKWDYIVFLLYNLAENTSALASLGA